MALLFHKEVGIRLSRERSVLIGEDKTGDDRWYETNVPLADRLYDECLRDLKEREKRHAADQEFQDTTEEDDA